MTLESVLLSSVPGIRHAFFTRVGGVSSGIYAGLNGGLGSKDEPEKVLENRRRMAAALDVAPDKLLTLYQVHSPDVVVATEPWQARPKGDAMVTKVPGIALGVTAADCGPVLLVDPKARVIGAAHAGWKGALAGVLEATIDAMEGEGASRGDIVAGLGPMLRQRNYEAWSSSPASRKRAPTTRASSHRPRATATRCSICRATSTRGSRRPAC
jgi:YfiH family protein